MYNPSFNLAIATNQLTREEWLEAACVHLERDFKANGATLPRCRVSVGFGGSKSRINKVLGVHWHPKAASDNISQIFISPIANEASSVLATLVHELVHAVHPDDGHGKLFKRLARAIGLDGKLTATTAGASLKVRLEAIESILGQYPHAKLTPSQSGIKKQSTRMHKVSCICGYTVRVAQKWLDVGLPTCCCGLEMEGES